jgi:hypothetical protein
MWALVISLGIVSGLVTAAFQQKKEPTWKPAWRKAKLIRLARLSRSRKGHLTLDQAEDGAVLAREFDSPALEKEFKDIAEKLKVKRRQVQLSH